MMTIRGTIGAATLAALFAYCDAASAQGGFAPPELATTKVRDNIYMIRSRASGNVTVLTSADGVILIDDKFAMEHDGVMALLKKITDKPVRYVINTHLHGDHSGGNPAMRALGADLVASENARYIMAERQMDGLPNVTFDDHMRIYLGDKPIDLLYFGRGHTDGDIMVYLPDERLIITGDLFALWGPNLHLIDYSAGGSLREWSRTLERALQLDFDTVIPGHSGVTDRATMQAFLKDTVRMGEMVQEMNRAKRSQDDIKAMLKMEFGWSDFMMNAGFEGLANEMQ